MGEKGRELGGKEEGTGGKGGGNWEWGTPLSTPSEGHMLKIDLHAFHRVVQNSKSTFSYLYL